MLTRDSLKIVYTKWQRCNRTFNVFISNEIELNFKVNLTIKLNFINLTTNLATFNVKVECGHFLIGIAFKTSEAGRSLILISVCELLFSLQLHQKNTITLGSQDV